MANSLLGIELKATQAETSKGEVHSILPKSKVVGEEATAPGIMSVRIRLIFTCLVREKAYSQVAVFEMLYACVFNAATNRPSHTLRSCCASAKALYLSPLVAMSSRMAPRSVA